MQPDKRKHVRITRQNLRVELNKRLIIFLQKKSELYALLYLLMISQKQVGKKLDKNNAVFVPENIFVS